VGRGLAEELVEDRVKRLEEKVDRLSELPARVDGLDHRMQGVERRLGHVELQIVQLRTEMGDGFSAVLEVIDSSSKATQTLFKETNSQMRTLHEDLVERIKKLPG
jgi:chromosome segregation ATPase